MFTFPTKSILISDPTAPADAQLSSRFGSVLSLADPSIDGDDSVSSSTFGTPQNEIEFAPRASVTKRSTRPRAVEPVAPSPATLCAIRKLRLYLEKESESRYGYLKDVQNNEIVPLERAETILWLSELANYLECGCEVLASAIDLLDQLLCRARMRSKYLRVAAVACLLIACKCLQEEEDQPLVSDLVANCHPEFTENDLKRMELVVLEKLQWQVPSTSPMVMVQDMAAFACSKLRVGSGEMDELVEVVSSKFVSCAVSYELLRFKPSELAACLMCMELSSITGLSEEHLQGFFDETLDIDEDRIAHCSSLAVRHLRVAKAMFFYN